MTQTLVQIEGLSFSHGDRKIYDNISLDIQKGKITALMGPSGIGKTTLLRLIGGQIKPEQGHIYFDGHDVPNLKRAELYQLRRRMSMLFQSGALFSELNVFDNVAFPLREHTRLPEELIRTIVLMKLESVGLRGAAQLMPSQLSGGMARRAALARSIALDPELVMYDEPFAGLDPISLGVIGQSIRQLNDALGAASVLVTHDVSESLAIVDYVYFIGEGRVVAEGTPDEIRNSDDPYVHQFVQSEADGPVRFHYPAPAYLDALLGKIDA